MRAVVCPRYGPPEVLELREVPKPEAGPGEVLIKVHATTVTSGDWRVRSLSIPRGFRTLARLALGWSRPRQPILGTELAGEVETVGAGVTRFKAGDAVFAFRGAKMGAYAEYICVAEDGLIAPKPTTLTFGEAAALPFGGTTALDFFRRGSLRAGEHVLINGASGGVGSAAVQIAVQLGARVTAVCGPSNLAWVKALGAAEVLDYTHSDFTQAGQIYDVIMDNAGTAPFSRSHAALARGGRLLLVLASMGALLHALWASLTSGRKVIAGPASERREDLETLAKLAQEGKLRPNIDQTFALDDIVAAHRYVDLGHKRGNVVVDLGGAEGR